MTHTHHLRHDPYRRPGRPRPLRPTSADAVDRPPGTPADPLEALTGERLVLSVTEAAGVLGISRALAYELVARGELPAVHLGRRLLVPKTALLELLGLSRPSFA